MVFGESSIQGDVTFERGHAVDKSTNVAKVTGDTRNHTQIDQFDNTNQASEKHRNLMKLAVGIPSSLVLFCHFSDVAFIDCSERGKS